FCFLAFGLLPRGEFLGFRLLPRGKLFRPGFFARDALALPPFFSGSLEAQSFLCDPLALPLQLYRLARALPLLRSLEARTLLLLCGFRPRRIHGIAGPVLLPRRLRSLRFVHFLPADPCSI